MFSISELKGRANITAVWSALGGGQLRHGRGRAFWRDGDGFSVSLDAQRGLWHDFVSGDGGDVVGLVQIVQQCDFKSALRWLADFTGAAEFSARGDNRTDLDWAADLRWADWWAIAAEMLAEWALEELPAWHPERFDLTNFLRTIRLGDAALVSEFRAWRRRCPKMTAGMVHAGRRSDARRQRNLAHWLKEYLNASQTA